MAWIVKLVEGTTSTIDLDDRVVYFLNVHGFYAPPPERRMAFAGENLQRHGGDLVARVYANRPITAEFQIKAANGSALGSAVQVIWDVLRRADQWARDGIGTQVQVAYQWEAGGSIVYFNIIEGVLDLGPDVHSPYLLQGTRIRNARLQLLAQPFAVGTSQTLSNLVKDPSYEVAGSALADWTIGSTGTGTAVRATGPGKYGTAYLELRRTASATLIRVSQTLGSGVTGSNIYSAGVYYLIPSGGASGLMASGRVEWYNTGGTLIASATATGTATGTAWVLLTMANNTIPATAGTFILYSESTGGSGAGTVRFDNWYLGTGAALPVAWVSGRDMANHFDDQGQAHLNYLDIYGLPGDVTGLMQIKAAESEAHEAFWMGARHAGRVTSTGLVFEGEAFTGAGTVLSIITTGSLSAGSALNFIARPYINSSGVSTGGETSTVVFNVGAFTGTNRVALFFVHGSAAVSFTSTVTYQSTAMSLLVQGSALSGTAYLYAAIHYLAGPPTASGTALIIFTTSVLRGIVSASWFGPNQTTAMSGGSSTINGPGGTHGTVMNDDILFGAMTGLSGPQSGEDGTTLVRGTLTGAVSYGVYYKDAGSTSNATGTTLGIGNVLAGTTQILVMGRLRGGYSPTGPYVMTATLAAPLPAGAFRMLARARGSGTDNWKLGMGYSYGNLSTITPTSTSQFADIPSSQTGFRILDLGLLLLPPVPVPVGATAGTLTLRLSAYKVTTATGNLDVDYIFLMPVGQGYLYGTKANAQDVLLSDSASPLQALYIMDTADVALGVPANQLGSPPEVHPQATRLYLLADQATNTGSIGHSWTVTAILTPRYLNVG